MWDSIIDFNALIPAACGMAAAVAVFSVVLMLRVWHLRNLARKREAHLERFGARWARIFERPPQHHDVLPAVNEADVLPWMLMWNRAQETAYGFADAGERRAYLNDVASREGMTEVALRWAGRRDVVDCLQAVTMLGHLREVRAVRTLRMLCESESALISVASARALLQINAMFRDRFAILLVKRTDWPPGKVIAVVRQERGKLARPMLELCRTAPPAVVRRIVPYARYLERADALSAIRYVVSTAFDPETLAAALKALAAIGTPADAPSAARKARHDDWRVRVQAANALAAIGGESDVPLLASMLNDGQWWVRYRAGLALGAIAGRCGTDLGAILQSREDRFAREVLAQIIAERAPLLEGAVS